jgi:integrase
VFPFLTSDMTPRQQKTTITQLVKITNKYMKRIGQALGVTTDIKTYEARRSFASAVLKAGGGLVYIKEKPGQSSLKSTEAYLTTILDEDEQSVLRKLLLGD